MKFKYCKDLYEYATYIRIIMYTKLFLIGYYLKLVLYAGNFYHKN